MFLGEPPRSQYDIHFRLFGIPVRIHPFFWVVALVLGIGGRDTPPGDVLLWIVAMLISIVIHELGHALTQRHFGGRPRIVLHSLGGLAICDDCYRDTRSQILIILAGPMAGFAFATALLLLMRVTGQGLAIEVGNQLIYRSGMIEGAGGYSILGVGVYWRQTSSPLIHEIFFNLLQINILWGVINLLPIYPLDGGQISREVCQIGNPRGGIILSLQISMVAAAGMAVFGLLVWQSIFTTVMFGYMAYSSHQTLQSYRQHLW